MNTAPHQSVLLEEVLQAFSASSIPTFLEGTLGAGGHAESLLIRHKEIKKYIGIDQDPSALALASSRLSQWSSQLVFIHSNFSCLDEIAAHLSIASVDGILLDLGVSSMQFDQAERGFSFSHDGPLDMRMNPHQSLTASEIVNTYPEKELGEIFREYGEEKQWRAAARLICQARKNHPFTTTAELVNVLKGPLSRFSKKGIHPLTLIFQALRICVNNELDLLATFLPKAIDFLAPKGRLAVISFHSGEDRIVKNAFSFAASDKWETRGIGGLFRDKKPLVRLITRKPIVPTREEMERNPRSRSAKLRIIEKLETE